MKENVIAVFDVGRTNKKFLLFDQDYNIVLEDSIQAEDVVDEDGFPCEDINFIAEWIEATIKKTLKNPDYKVIAVNFSAHGAGLVYVDENGEPLTPLYSYLKPLEENISNQFYKSFGDKAQIAQETASPAMGMLNSGLQLYRLKYANPKVFNKVKHVFHLPQYCSWLLHKTPISELTSIGCHTAMWDFDKNDYHQWLNKEELDKLLPPVADSFQTITAKRNGHSFEVGMGMHDSSASLVPYFSAGEEPFILISTGTWSIALNPFNNVPLTDEELKRDCLCFMNFRGEPVKASRLFIGNEHEHQVKKLSQHFNKSEDYFKTVYFNREFFNQFFNLPSTTTAILPETMQGTGPFEHYPGHPLDPARFISFEEAYHFLLFGLTTLQLTCINLVRGKSDVNKIFVDGGFGKNDLFLKMLSHRLPQFQVYSAKLPQASATGVAMVMNLKNKGFESEISKLMNLQLQ